MADLEKENKAEEPENKAKEPKNKAEEPENRAEDPENGTGVPESGAQAPQSAVNEPKSEPETKSEWPEKEGRDSVIDMGVAGEDIFVEDLDADEEDPGEKKRAKAGKKKAFHAKKRPEADDLMNDLEFITADTAKDRSRMVESSAPRDDDELVSKKKTARREADEMDSRKERSLKMMVRHLPLLIVGILVVIILICVVVIGVRNLRERWIRKNREQPVSAQEYEKDEYAEINTLIENYYDAYADGDTDVILQYANPMTDKEKSYIEVYSQFVESYENVVCYTKTGADDTSFIVSVAFDLKYRDVDTMAPGLDFFYVRTGGNGEMYIDNVYSPFNLVYQENPLDEEIRQLIEAYQTGEDVIALQANVQTRYDAALEKDEALRTMVEQTMASAVSEWASGQNAVDQQREQEAAAQVSQSEQQTLNPDAGGVPTVNFTETEDSAWVYTTDGVRVRQMPDENATVLTSVNSNVELHRIAVTDNGWSKVDTGDQVGYVKSDYLTDQRTLTPGQVIHLTEAVNVRASMSETAEKVGVAYADEEVKVEEVSDEGWTKITWNGSSGYVRTDLLLAQ